MNRQSYSSPPQHTKNHVLLEKRWRWAAQGWISACVVVSDGGSLVVGDKSGEWKNHDLDRSGDYAIIFHGKEKNRAVGPSGLALTLPVEAYAEGCMATMG